MSKCASEVALMAMEMDGRSSLSAGQALPTGLGRRQMSWSTVRGPADEAAAAARRGFMLHRQEKNVESRISKETDVKKIHERTPRGRRRRVIAFGSGSWAAVSGRAAAATKEIESRRKSTSFDNPGVIKARRFPLGIAPWPRVV